MKITNYITLKLFNSRSFLVPIWHISPVKEYIIPPFIEWYFWNFLALTREWNPLPLKKN